MLNLQSLTEKGLVVLHVPIIALRVYVGHGKNKLYSLKITSIRTLNKYICNHLQENKMRGYPLPYL